MENYNKGVLCDHLSSRYPWLVGQSMERKDQIFYTLHKPQLSHYMCQITELLGKRIRACFHGWVILSNHPYNVMWSLWDPITSKIIRLPPMTKKLGDFHECCLSSPPDDPQSILLFTTTEKPTIIFCRLDRERKKLSWTEMSYARQYRNVISDEDGFLENPTCYNGKVYAMTVASYHDHVIEVDIVVKNKKVVISLSSILKMPSVCFNRCPFYKHSTMNHYLKGSCTDLFYIAIDFEDETRKTVAGVCLFKLDMTRMSWEEIEDLKDTIFFIELASDEDSVFYRRGIDSELGGYINILDEMGKVIYSYNVKSRSISLSSMPCLVLKSQVPTWAMLECRLEGDPADFEQQEEDKDDQIVVTSAIDGEAEFDCMTSESHLLGIPVHILEMIMEYSVCVEYMNFRAICKLCHLAAPPIQWSNEITSRRLQMYSLDYPWLMVFDKYQGIITFTDPLLGDEYFIKTPTQLIGFQIYCSRYGWLLMYKIDGPMVFYNPFKNDILELPEVPYLESFCFSAPPTSSDCMVVGFKSVGECQTYIHFVAGEPVWREFGGDDDPCSFQFPTFYGQDLYALCNDRGIDVFKKMGHEDYSWERVIAEAPRSCCTTQARRFLAKCDQHLFLVVVGEFGELIEVFGLSESTKEWDKVDSLGKHMIYLCGTTCLCLEAKLPEMENKIYFPRLHSTNRKIVVYSLETCRYQTFGVKAVEESFVDFLGTQYYSNPHTWIEPSWS